MQCSTMKKLYCVKQLRWLQLRVSALSIGHHQVVLRLIEELYNKQGILGLLYGGLRYPRYRPGCGPEGRSMNL